jgi:hypothetical protein
MGDHAYLCLNVDLGGEELKQAPQFALILANGHEVIHFSEN